MNMGFHGIFSVLLVIALFYNMGARAREAQQPSGNGGSGVGNSIGARGAGLVLAPRVRYRARLSPGPPERFVIEDDDIIELSKKQMDDYGHLRFGKREDQFDDYGHLRFGRGDVE